MSGSAALASARRRRAIAPGANEVIDIPKPPVSQIQAMPTPTNPAMLLMKHNQLLGTLQIDIDDLKKQIDAQETELQDLVDERATEYDGGYAVAQAMLDSNVKFERQYLEMLEGSLANMRGESVLDRPGSYPFAYQQAKKNADAQRATLKAAEKRATEFKEVAKSDQQQMQEFWKDKLGGEGVEEMARGDLQPADEGRQIQSLKPSQFVAFDNHGRASVNGSSGPARPQ